MTMAEKTKSKRLVSLDILRGITIAGMLLVNNPGTWSHIYRPLDHAKWIGLTPTDLVFPFFMFCMGVAMYFSLKKFNFTMSGKLAVKIVRRTVLLFIIGWAVHWFSHLMYGLANGKPFSQLYNNLDSLRYLGVFQRLALCYFFGALCVVFIKHRFLPWVIGGILVVYAVILGVGHGYDFSTNNIIAVIDNAILGSDHMYHEEAFGTNIAFDPEGILSTLPCIAHTLIGFMVGKCIVEHKDNRERMRLLLACGFAFILGGWLLSYGIPCGKKVWSSSYVLITTGLAMSVLALLIHVVDVKGHHSWGEFFHAFGVNPLALYLLGSILSIIFGATIVWRSADYSLPQPEQAQAEYQQAAQAGVAQAQNNWAVMTMGENQAQATTLLQQAAQAGLPEAKYNLGLTLAQDSNPANDTTAVRLLTQAADSGNVNAQMNLGLITDFGLNGVQPNHQQAERLYSQAADGGLEMARQLLPQCFADTVGLTAHFKASDLMITSLAKCGPIEGDSLTQAQAAYNHGVQLESGSGERKSVKAAAMSGLTAIAQGNVTLASCLYAILFVLLNWVFGFILYKKKIIIKI